jgi:NDP-sugar pyrophosphorylase family protein
VTSDVTPKLTTVRQVVILAGGLGTRLRPLTEKVPKPMVPVADQPFLYWQLRDLKAQGYTRVLLLVAYLGEQVEAYFGDGAQFGMHLEYVYEHQPLGTGGAVKNASSKLDAEFILLNGDSFLRAPLKEMEKAFVDVDALVSTYDNYRPVPVIPNIKTSAGRVTGYEKDAGLAKGFTEIDSGIYILKRSLIEGEGRDIFMLADFWPQLIEQGRLAAFAVSERFYDIGTIERLKEFEEKVRDYFPHSASH